MKKVRPLNKQILKNDQIKWELKERDENRKNIKK